ncbi:hypothetical protein DFH27DRAFT_506573, partial [Peziza echinospora]
MALSCSLHDVQPPVRAPCGRSDGSIADLQTDTESSSWPGVHRATRVPCRALLDLASTTSPTSQITTNTTTHGTAPLMLLQAPNAAAAAAPPRIRLLPEDATARLRSTLTITTLAQAVSELVQNSLDAGAQEIRVHANFARNSCVVEDDGCGIAPDDLALLGQRYATSKYVPGGPSTFGHLGVGIASLATASLLTLVTRCATHRSTQTARFAYSPAAVQAGPAQDHQRLPRAGTTARIEGLFANVPVRVQAQQAGLDEQREWDGLRRMLAALLLADPRGSARAVALVARDASGRKMALRPHAEADAPREIQLLQQAYSVRDVGPASAWERVRAARGAVSIEGWICTLGSPSRRYQFISINSHPLAPPPQGSNVLHAALNRLFGQSTFGTAVDNPDDKLTKKANKPRKGVDKYPRCILRIECLRIDEDLLLIGGEGGTGEGSGGKGGMEGDNLRQCVDLLQRLVEQFLKVHSFKPRSNTPKTLPSHFSPPVPFTAPRPSTASSTSSTSSRPPKRRRTRPSSSSSHASAISGIGGWTSKTKPSPREPQKQVWSKPSLLRDDSMESVTSGDTPIHSQDAQIPSQSAAKPTPTLTPSQPVSTTIGTTPSGESYLRYLNPITNKATFIDHRTGNTIKDPTTPSSSTSFEPRKSLTLKRPHSRQENNPPGPLIQSFLSNFKTPIFGIDPATGRAYSRSSSNPSQKPIQALRGFVPTKLTREGLRRGRVVGQVDGKFILVVMKSGGGEGESAGEDDDVLVLIDQHAADERWRVEALYEELCRPYTPPPSPPQIDTTNTTQDEQSRKFGISTVELTLSQREGFAEWGVGYLISPAMPAGDSGIVNVEKVTITHVPPIILDRILPTPLLGRDMLKAYLWELHHRRGRSRKSTVDHTLEGGEDNTGKKKQWYTSIPSAPAHYRDIIPSRACRSAIMFGDVLGREECVKLVERVGGTRFWGVCAHGRPSAVGVVRVGGEGGGEG